MNRAAAKHDSPPVFHPPTVRFRDFARAPFVIPSILFLACLVLAGTVQWIYKDAAHTQDDIYYQLELGLALSGKSTFAEFVVRPYAGHVFLLWKMFYAAEHYLFGLEPGYWHAVVALIQAISAILLYAWLRLFSRRQLGPACGALLWSAVAIGRWDNPLIWLVCATIPLSVIFLLVGMIAAVQYSQTGQRKWLFAIAGSTFLSVGVWSISWILTVMIGATSLLLHFAPRQDREGGDCGRAGWKAALLAWLVPFLLFAPLALTNTLPETQTSLQGSAISGFSQALGRTFSQFAVALGNLTFWNADRVGSEELGLKWAFMGLIVGVMVLTSLRRWRDLSLMFACGGLYLLGVNLSRSQISLEAAMSSGRYFYLATLPWCASLGAIIDGITISIWKRARLAGGIIACATVPLLVAHQWRVADVAVRHFETVAGPARLRFLQNQQLLALLDESGRVRQQPVRLPNIPLYLPPVDSVLFPLSAYKVVTFPQGLNHVEVVGGEEYSPKDEEVVLNLLNAIQAPIAQEWANAVRGVTSFQRALIWLSKYAGRKRMEILLPDFDVSMNAVHFPISQFLAMTFRDGANLGLRTVPPSTPMPEAMKKLLLDLRSQTDPLAARWIPIFERWEKSGPPNDGNPGAPSVTGGGQP
ncbi:MAG: hypothetical protein U1D30_10140 [Planctomycetota bacterium]